MAFPSSCIRLQQGDSDRAHRRQRHRRLALDHEFRRGDLVAANDVAKKGREIASHVLEAAPADIEFSGGKFRIAGTDRAIGIVELAAKLRDGGLALPDGAPTSLDASHVSKGEIAAYPNGCHICEVEIDPDTGID